MSLSEELGASNTLWMEDGKLQATNTDGRGFTANLDERHPGWDKARPAVIFGAGGASRAVIQAVRDRGFKNIHVVNRTVEPGAGVGRSLRCRQSKPIRSGALTEVMNGAGLFINTTSLGMDGEAAPRNRLLATAAGRGRDRHRLCAAEDADSRRRRKNRALHTVDGLGMLLHQAVPGFEKWFGQRPVVDPGASCTDHRRYGSTIDAADRPHRLDRNGQVDDGKAVSPKRACRSTMPMRWSTISIAARQHRWSMPPFPER